MEVSAPIGDSFVQLLGQLSKPLRFASSDQFARLDRVKGLEETLHNLGQKAFQQAATPHQKDLLKLFITAIPRAEEKREQRVIALTRCIILLEKITINAPRSDTTQAGAQSNTQSNTVTSFGNLPASSSVLILPGVGPKMAEKLAIRDLLTLGDCLRFLPRRYQNRVNALAIAKLQADSLATVVGVIKTKTARAFRGRRRLEITINDGTGTVLLRWFRVPHPTFVERFNTGEQIRVAGSVKRYKGRLTIAHPEVEFLDEQSGALVSVESEEKNEIVPLYLDIEGVNAKSFRKILDYACARCEEVQDPIPWGLRKAHQLPPLMESMRALHHPPSNTPLEQLQNCQTPWHQRLIYEEFLLLQLAVLLRKQGAARKPAWRFLSAQRPILERAVHLFSFAFTHAQRRTLREIEGDFCSGGVMQRLLQGDVGSGKTAVALSAAAYIAASGAQVALMAPTEILAEQLARHAKAAFIHQSFDAALLTSGTPTPERRDTLNRLQKGELAGLVGPHALIQDAIKFNKLALAIIDEQHRFGVKQRAQLSQSALENCNIVPHLLLMSATPIPRTLALSAYGDLDVSVLNEMPPGRQPVRTTIHKDNERQKAYAEVAIHLAKGEQGYVVFPLVAGSDKEGMENIRDATQACEELQHGILHKFNLALLHGKMNRDEKEAVMSRFIAGNIDLLVCTTVIEVGVDVANATVMVVEHAERFGLSQLHQLRGRVGRGDKPSRCLLISAFTHSTDALKRLAIMEHTTDGFKIAQEDLKIRGPGDFLGTRQAGLPTLSIADLVRDQAILVTARKDAKKILEHDPKLQQPQHQALKQMLTEQWKERLDLLQLA